MSMYDINNDGYIDSGTADTNVDGILDQNAVDTDGDAVADTWLVDRDQDGLSDARGYDTNANGVIDVVDDDSDENGLPERRVLDVNEDSVPDGLAPVPNMSINADGTTSLASPWSTSPDLSNPEVVDQSTGVYLDDIARDLHNAPHNPAGSPQAPLPDDVGVAEGLERIAIAESNTSQLGPQNTVNVYDDDLNQRAYQEPGNVTPETAYDNRNDGY